MCANLSFTHNIKRQHFRQKKNNFQAHGRFKVLWGVLCIGNSDKAIRHSNIRSSTPFIIIPVWLCNMIFLRWQILHFFQYICWKVQSPISDIAIKHNFRIFFNSSQYFFSLKVRKLIIKSPKSDIVIKLNFESFYFNSFLIIQGKKLEHIRPKGQKSKIAKKSWMPWYVSLPVYKFVFFLPKLILGFFPRFEQL